MTLVNTLFSRHYTLFLSFYSRFAKWPAVLVMVFASVHPLAAQSPAPAAPAVHNTAQVNKTEDTMRLSKRIFPAIRRNINRYVPFYFFLLLGGCVMIAAIRIINPPYLKNLIQASVNNKLLMSLFKEGIFGFNATNLLLDVLCIGMLGMLIQIFYFPKQEEFFLWIMAFTAVAYVLKLILIQFLANIFLSRNEALMHMLMHMLFTRILGLVLLPVLFVGLYQTIVDINILLGIVVFVIMLFYTGWLLRLYVRLKSISPAGFVYLFLYLCTVELSPIAVILKDYIR